MVCSVLAIMHVVPRKDKKIPKNCLFVANVAKLFAGWESSQVQAVK